MSIEELNKTRNSTIDGILHMQRVGDAGSFGYNEAIEDLKELNKKLEIERCPNCKNKDPICYHKLYTIYDVNRAEHTLEPLICILCKSTEVTYHQYIGNANCASCGQWQIDD